MTYRITHTKGYFSFYHDECGNMVHLTKTESTVSLSVLTVMLFEYAYMRVCRVSIRNSMVVVS